MAGNKERRLFIRYRMNFLSGKNILVTGATGLVGTNILFRLKTIAGVRVKAVCHAKEPRIFSDNISYIKADLTKADECKKVVQGIDYVMMFAAKIVRRPDNFAHLIENLNMNFQMLEAAYHAVVKKIIWLSSAAAYPFSEMPLEEERMFAADPPDECFPLAWAVRYTEILCRMYATKLKRRMTIIVLRPTAIYGENDNFNFATSHVLPALIRKVIERHNPIEIWGSGEVKRDFIYVGDVIGACFLALKKVEGFGCFNIGAGCSYSVKEILEMILKIDNYRQAPVVYGHSKEDRRSISIDCKKAKEILGFTAKTSLRDGITNTVIWYKANQRKSGERIEANNV